MRYYPKVYSENEVMWVHFNVCRNIGQGRAITVQNLDKRGLSVVKQQENSSFLQFETHEIFRFC